MSDMPGGPKAFSVKTTAMVHLLKSAVPLILIHKWLQNSASWVDGHSRDLCRDNRMVITELVYSPDALSQKLNPSISKTLGRRKASMLVAGYLLLQRKEF